MPSVGGVFISVLGWEITDLFFHGPRTRSGGDNRMFPLRHVALVFTRASPVGGAARMFRIFPHLGLLLLVSDGFHRGGDEGCVPAHEELFRVLSRCFHVTFPCWGGASRMSRIFPHLVLLHVVSDGFHLGGEEGSGPGFILCVELLGSV